MSEDGTKGWKEKYVDVDRQEGTQEGDRSWFC